MKKENKKIIINYLKKWGIIFILSFTLIIFMIDVYENYSTFKDRSNRMKKYYIAEQKEEIKQQVMQTVNMINLQLGLMKKRMKNLVKDRGDLAYNFINNYYLNNKGKMNNKKIEKLIIDNLRKIKYRIGGGGYFIDSLSGRIIMFPKAPSLEGENLMDIKNSKGEYVFRKEFEKIKKTGEILVYGAVVLPKVKDTKIVYLKLFKPFDWVIGSYVYINSIKRELGKELLRTISKIRFGKEGYIFVNRFDGNALVSNGKIFRGDKKLWEVFNKNPKKVKEVFQKEYKAALKPNGDYIYYSFAKLTDLNKVSPKTSFIYGIPELKWIVGAGVYLDDVEKEISTMKSDLLKEIKVKLVYFLIIVFFIVVVFLIILEKMTGKFKNDLELFASFFDKAAYSDEYIDIDKVKFLEFGRLAENANKMVEEKTKFQKELSNEKERLFVTIRSIGDGVITTDEKGKIIVMNKTAENLTGWSLKEAHGKDLKSIFNIIDKDTGKPVESLVERVLKNGRIVKLKKHTVLISKNGNEYIIEDSAAPIRDIESKIIGVVVVFRDITEKIRIEEELLKVRKLESVGILAGGIAHDFNNILTGIFGNLEIAKMKIGKEHPSYKFIETADKALERAVNLTKQLLTFAKGGEPILGVVDLESIVINTVNFNLSGSKIKANYEIPKNLWKIKADKGQISQVLSNLIINAKEAMPYGGNIYIKGENVKIAKDNLMNIAPGNYVRLSIRDEGIGISNKHIDKIFDPYFTTKQAGSGLGLAITHSIIKKHGGDIKVESIIDKGTIFTIYIPVAEESLEKKEYKEEKFIKKTENRYKILVMDDEEFIRDIAKEMLSEIGYTVETVKNGKEAIDLYKKAKQDGKPFDLIIMDLTIPGSFGGKETISEILKFDKNVKAIVSSGYSTDPIMANYEKYGFKGRLAKPFNFDQLKEVVSDILSD